MRYLLVDLFAAITTRNADKVIRVGERMSVGSRRLDRRRLEKEVTLLLNKYREFGPGQTKIGTVGLEMLYLFGSNGIVVSPDYALLSQFSVWRRALVHWTRILTSKQSRDLFLKKLIASAGVGRV